jgi:hypothetical protein
MLVVVEGATDVLEQCEENLTLVNGPVQVRSALKRYSSQLTLLAGPDVADGICNPRHAYRS